MSGSAWVFGDDVNTDALAPGAYMRFGIEEIARHCMEELDPRFAKEVRPADVIVAGRNFGAGSSREQAVEAPKHLGVAAIVAVSYAGLFYRNAFNLGLPLIVCSEALTIRPGDMVEVDLDAAQTLNLTRGVRLSCDPIPPNLIALVRSGGLLPYLERRLAKNQPAAV